MTEIYIFMSFDEYDRRFRDLAKIRKGIYMFLMYKDVRKDSKINIPFSLFNISLSFEY